LFELVKSKLISKRNNFFFRNEETRKKRNEESQLEEFLKKTGYTDVKALCEKFPNIERDTIKNFVRGLPNRVEDRRFWEDAFHEIKACETSHLSRTESCCNIESPFYTTTQQSTNSGSPRF